MPTLITSADIYAKDIKAWVDGNPDVLSESDAWYAQVLAKYGLTLADAANPIPYAVKQCCLLHIYMIACRAMIGVSLRQSADGVMEDPYVVKYGIYKKDYTELYSTINYDMLAGRKPVTGIGSSRIWRG